MSPEWVSRCAGRYHHLRVWVVWEGCPLQGARNVVGDPQKEGGERKGAQRTEGERERTQKRGERADPEAQQREGKSEGTQGRERGVDPEKGEGNGRALCLLDAGESGYARHWAERGADRCTDVAPEGDRGPEGWRECIVGWRSHVNVDGRRRLRSMQVLA